MNAFLALVRKDILQYLGNRRAVLMSIVAPILIAAFFGSLFGGNGSPGSKNDGPAQIPVAITDLDGSATSRAVLASLEADTAFKLQRLDAAAGEAAVRGGDVKAWITLPAGFGAQAGPALFGGGARPQVTLWVDPSQSMIAPLVRGVFAQHAMQEVMRGMMSAQGGTLQTMRAQVEASTQLDDGRRRDLLALFDSMQRVGAAGAGTTASSAPSTPSSASAAAAAAGPAGSGGTALSLPFDLAEREAAAAGPGAGYNAYAHAFAGMGVQFILMMGVDIGIGLLLLRQQGLWKRLRAAPLSPLQLLGSRVASCALIAFGVFAVVFAVAVAVFGVRIHGSVAGLVLVMAAYALTTAAFGLMIAAIGRTPEATRGLAILVTLLLVMVGGGWVPSFIFPPWLQAVSAWTPTHWAIEGLDAMSWRGLPFSRALPPAALLLGFALAFGAIALARWRADE